MTQTQNNDAKDPDFIVSGSGTVYLLHPMNAEAKAWLAENCGGETTWWGNALGVEHRFIDELVAGIRGDGLEVSDAA